MNYNRVFCFSVITLNCLLLLFYLFSIFIFFLFLCLLLLLQTKYTLAGKQLETVWNDIDSDRFSLIAPVPVKPFVGAFTSKSVQIFIIITYFARFVLIVTHQSYTLIFQIQYSYNIHIAPQLLSPIITKEDGEPLILPDPKYTTANPTEEDDANMTVKIDQHNEIIDEILEEFQNNIDNMRKEMKAKQIEADQLRRIEQRKVKAEKRSSSTSTGTTDTNTIKKQRLI